MMPPGPNSVQYNLWNALDDLKIPREAKHNMLPTLKLAPTITLVALST
jgi:hypothetical protein